MNRLSENSNTMNKIYQIQETFTKAVGLHPIFIALLFFLFVSGQTIVKGQNPSFVTGYPTISETNSTSIKVKYSFQGMIEDEDGDECDFTYIKVRSVIIATGNPTNKQIFNSDYYNGTLARIQEEITENNALNEIELTGLTPSTTYKLAIAVRIVTVDEEGSSSNSYAYSDPIIIQFTTAAEATPPVIAEKSPAHGATDVKLNPTLTITFNENIVKGVMPKFIAVCKVLQPEDAKYIAINSPSVVVTDNQISIPVTGLSEDTEYYVTVDAGFVKSATSGVDFAGISDSNTWRFTTGKAPQLAEENALLPAHQRDKVPVDTVITVTFREDIQFNSTSDYKYITISGDGDSQSFEVSSESTSNKLSIVGNKLIITPSTLSYGTTYKVTIGAGVVESLAAIPFAGINGNNWSFETVPPPSPVGTLTIPASDNSHISILTDVIIDYDMAIYYLNNGTKTTITNSNIKSLITIHHGIEGEAEGTLLDPSLYTVTISSDKKKVTIKLTPNGFYEPDKIVRVTVAKLCNVKSIEQSEEESFTFKTDKYNIWTGTTDSSWGTSSNWRDGYEEGNGIVINPATNGAVLSTNVHIPSLIVAKGAKLTINSGAKLTINDDFRMYSGNSGAGASLLVNGSLVSNPAKTVVYQDISNYDYNYYFSSPVVGATKDVITSTGRIFSYNTSTDKYDLLSSGDILEGAKGYVGYAPSGSVLSFQGSINQNSTYALPCQITTPNYGWNLAGNPYPCAIDLATTYDNAGFSDLKPHIYIRDNATSQLTAWNFIANTGTTNGTEIPSMHSFWVQVDREKPSGIFTVHASDRIHNTKTLHKSIEAPINQNPTIKFYTQNGVIKDMSVVTFIPGISDSYDNYDTEKRLAKKETITESYTIKDGTKLVINSYSEFNGSREIPVGLYAGKGGTFTFGIASVTGFESDIDIKLIDKKESVIHDFANGDYSFSVSKGNTDNRFVLQIANKVSTGIDKNEEQSLLSMFSDRNNVVLVNNGTESASYTLYDISGRIISEGFVEAHSRINVSIGIKGIILGTVKTNNHIVNKKLLIQE